MELLTIASDAHLLVDAPEEENATLPLASSTIARTTAGKLSYKEEQEKYYKESIIINYQRYKALFRSRLVCNILIDDKNVIRDLNKKAKDDFAQITGSQLKIGSSLAVWLNEKTNTTYHPLLHHSTNECMDFELQDVQGHSHHFQVEVILLVSPEENRLLKCISAIRVG